MEPQHESVEALVQRIKDSFCTNATMEITHFQNTTHSSSTSRKRGPIQNRGDEEVMGKFGVKERNLEGQMVVDFAKRMDMGVVNTYFQKREEHRVTYKSGGRRTQVDYILCRRGNLKEISDCKVVVGESVARQHRMVVCRMTLMVCKTKRSKIEIEKKTKWWKLKKEECCEEFRQKLRQALGGQVVLPDDWETTAEVIRETGRKVLGVSSGRRKEDKETWWWNEEVQDSIQRKRLAKKKWDMNRTEENRQEYKELQRRVKREVSKAKQKAYDELYTRLDTREGEKDLYRLARQRDRDGKDVQQVRVIKDREGRVLTSEESVQRRWKEYFEELMNEENEREKRVEGVNSVEQKVDKIRKDEVRKALKRMKSGKVLENLEKAYDRVPREELWYCMRKSGVAEKYVRVVQDMYERSRTVVRCAVVMYQLSEEVRQESPWTMMFADDIVICSESREQVEENLERWRFALERRGMKVSRIQSNGECGKEPTEAVNGCQHGGGVFGHQECSSSDVDDENQLKFYTEHRIGRRRSKGCPQSPMSKATLTLITVSTCILAVVYGSHTSCPLTVKVTLHVPEHFVADGSSFVVSMGSYLDVSNWLNPAKLTLYYQSNSSSQWTRDYCGQRTTEPCEQLCDQDTGECSCLEGYSPDPDHAHLCIRTDWGRNEGPWPYSNLERGYDLVTGEQAPEKIFRSSYSLGQGLWLPVSKSFVVPPVELSINPVASCKTDVLVTEDPGDIRLYSSILAC
ncbi:hypothetical protein QTP86_032410 [Hemibagrus guttatus]|nr:hypothetical protein QTP86_032410 [Hemibagrus guttatus]